MIHALKGRDYDAAELGVLYLEARSLVLADVPLSVWAFQAPYLSDLRVHKFKWNTFFCSRKTCFINLFYLAME